MSTPRVVLALPVDSRRAFVQWRTLTFWSLLVGYAAYYLCRPNLAASAGFLAREEGIDTLAFGSIASIGTLCYAAGKFAAGPLAERFGGRRVFLAGLFGSAVVTALVGVSHGIVMLTLFWGAGRLMQSVGWQGLVDIIPRWHDRSEHGAAMGLISTSYQFGGALAPLLLGALIAWGLGWRSLFVLPAALLAAVGLLVAGGIVNRPQDKGLPGPDARAKPELQPQPPQPWTQRASALLGRPAFLMALGTAFVLTLLRECFNTWMPKYFLDLGESADVALFKSTVFPLLGILGSLVAGHASDRLSGGRRGPVMALFLGGLFAALIGLAHVDGLVRWLAPVLPNVTPGSVAVVLVGAAGFFIFGPYSMIGGGVVALDFGGTQSAATAAGLLDGIGYFGASLAGVGVARVVGAWGWPVAFDMLAGLAAVAAVLTLPLWRRRAAVTG